MWWCISDHIHLRLHKFHLLLRREQSFLIDECFHRCFCLLGSSSMFQRQFFTLKLTLFHGNSCAIYSHFDVLCRLIVYQILLRNTYYNSSDCWIRRFISNLPGILVHSFWSGFHPMPVVWYLFIFSWFSFIFMLIYI